MTLQDLLDYVVAAKEDVLWKLQEVYLSWQEGRQKDRTRKLLQGSFLHYDEEEGRLRRLLKGRK